MSRVPSLIRRLRLLLMGLHPSAVLCSPLRRTRESVAPYVEAAGLEVVFDGELIEAHIGGWEGLPFEEIVASDADLVHRLRNQQAIWSRAPGGESTSDFRRRVVGPRRTVRFLNDIAHLTDPQLFEDR